MSGLIILIVALSLFALGTENKYIAVISMIFIGTSVALNPAMVARVMKTAIFTTERRIKWFKVRNTFLIKLYFKPTPLKKPTSILGALLFIDINIDKQ